MGDTTATDTSASTTPSEQTSPQQSAAPAAPAPAAPSAAPPNAAPVQSPATPAVPQSTTPAQPPQSTEQAQGDLTWLPERLQRAKQTAVGDLCRKYNVKDEAELQAKLDRLSRLERESMTEAERRQAEIDELKPVAAKVEQYRTIMEARVVAELADLTDEQRAAVEALSGDDPAQQLRTIDALKPTWAKEASQAAPAPAAAPASPPAPQAPPQPAADTAPGRASAPSETHDSPPNHKVIWDGLRQSNPFAASAYYRQHAQDINKGLIPSES